MGGIAGLSIVIFVREIFLRAVLGRPTFLKMTGARGLESAPWSASDKRKK
jgi:hypothetical protein